MNLKRIITWLIIVIVVFSLGFLSGCGTISGACADIEYGAHVAKKAITPFHPDSVSQK